MKARQHNGYTKVSFTADDVRAFNSTWPCSCLPEMDGSVEFEPNGDLVDAPDWMDGTEGVVFVSYCQYVANNN